MQSFITSAFAFLLLCFQGDNLYQRRNQFCGGMNGLDITWKLDIKANGVYTFRVAEKKNDYLAKSRLIFSTGIWELNADTLKLTEGAKNGDVLTFYKSEGRLIFEGSRSKTRNHSFVYLDYLEQP